MILPAIRAHNQSQLKGVNIRMNVFFCSISFITSFLPQNQIGDIFHQDSGIKLSEELISRSCFLFSGQMVPIWCFTAAEMFGGEPAPGIGHHCSNGAGGNTICKLIMCICICICNEAGVYNASP